MVCHVCKPVAKVHIYIEPYRDQRTNLTCSHIQIRGWKVLRTATCSAENRRRSSAGSKLSHALWKGVPYGGVALSEVRLYWNVG